LNNTEHFEALLSTLSGQPVIVIQPSIGTISFSYFGTLAVTQGENHRCGFHITHPMGVVAIIFRAEDVVKLEEPGEVVGIKKIIRLRGPTHYNEKYERANV